MNYLAWALFAEGRTDIYYLETLLPRVVLELVQSADGKEATVPDNPVHTFGVDCRDFKKAAKEICTAKDAFSLFFVHGDTGSRSQEQTLESRTCALCDQIVQSCENFVRDRCVIVAPRRETEAWCLVDKNAIRSAYGVGESLDLSFIPKTANAIEAHPDPKHVLNKIQISLSGGRKRRLPPVPYAKLGQMQDLEKLRLLPSFMSFEAGLRKALATFGYSKFR